MPAPGTLTRWHAPSGPGVRLDGGYDQGETVPGAFDSLVAKLIVSGRDRTQALERSRRALDEFVVEGMPTVIPFHRAVVSDPAYVGAADPPARVPSTSTRPGSRPSSTTRSSPTVVTRPRRAEAEERQTVTVEVGGRRLEVVLPAGLGGIAAGAGAGAAKKPKRAKGKKAGAAASGDAVDLADAGHHRQGRRRGGPGGRRG